MKITSIGLYSNENEIANFDLDDPNSDSPYLARSILGLDADEIIPKFYGFSTINRNRLYDFAVKPREIVIRIALRPHRAISETYSLLRDNLYKAISAIRNGIIDVRFNTGIPWFAYIKGFITKFEAPHFSNSPEVTLTIYCEDGMIKGFNTLHFESDVSPTGLDPFTFVDNISTAPHGCQLELVASTTMPEIMIVDKLAIDPHDPDWGFRLVYPFLSGDKLYVNSQSGERTVTVTRGTTVIPIADKIAPESVWPVVFPGTNEFSFSSPGSLNMNYLEFTPEFWGV